jgi:nucleotide-binding universal stress UspA family protein
VTSVVHPTDFSEASEHAFVHALAIALNRQTSLTLLHVARQHPEGWERFPQVRSTLERWGRIPPGSPREAIREQLQVTVDKVALVADQALGGIVAYLGRHPSDLIVLATAGRDGLPAWIQPSLAEGIARAQRCRTLFVPAGARGFVSAKDGSVTLKRVLVPYDLAPDPGEALVLAQRVVRAAGGGEVHLVHAGPNPPALALPPGDDVPFVLHRAEGDVVDAILDRADGTRADLVVMATAGRHGILDALRGSVTERVLRHVPCPLLAVPAED